MKKVSRPHRCAQCGRTYTKAQWRRNDFWCPRCKKFVCYDCVGRGRVCPACGTRTNRRARRLSTTCAGIGGSFLWMSALLMLLSLDSPPLFLLSAVTMGFSIALLVCSIVFHVKTKERVKMHQEHLSRMPTGTIPLEERPGYLDPSARRKWSEANLATSVRASPMMKAYPSHIYYGLKADWDFPVMTKEERISMTAEVQSKGLVLGVGTVGMGTFLMALGAFVGLNVVVIMLGVMVILVGSMIVFISRYAKQMVQSDAKAKVKVPWKTVGFGTAKRAVEGFLEGRGLEWKLKKTKLPMWAHPEHTYELEDGNEVSFTYNEDSSGYVYGWVEIGFRPSGALAARRLQQELDEYLCERDLIRRIG